MQLVAPKETQVIAACKDALTAQNDYALKALIAGQLLLEYRQTVAPSGHDGRTGKFLAKTEDESFTKWVESQGIAERTARRWMQAAERVARAQLGLSMDATFSPVIELGGGESISMSKALTAPEKGLPEKALKFRQGIFDFMAEHTLSEAATAVVDGESDGKRITLAAGGKKTGGKGSADRKDFPLFMAKNLVNFTGNLKGWEKWRAKQPAQYAAVCSTLEKFVLTGGKVATHASGAGKDVEAWPLSFCELLADLLKKRLKQERQ